MFPSLIYRILIATQTPPPPPPLQLDILAEQTHLKPFFFVSTPSLQHDSVVLPLLSRFPSSDVLLR